MKIFFLIASLFTMLSMTAQPNAKNLIVFHTYEEYKNGNGKDYGLIIGMSNSSWGANKFRVEDGKRKNGKTINLNKIWGFKIGDYLFRMNTYSHHIPLVVVNGKEKVFYIDGYMILNREIWNREPESFRDTDGCFYSDDLASEVFEITKMIKNEKDNANLKHMIECIEEAKERLGAQSKFNGYMQCIQN